MNSLELVHKVERVIASCTNKTQLDAAQRYLELFFQKSRDLENFRLLISKLNEKIDSLA